MNLLKDRWIPVKIDCSFQRISLEELLTSCETQWELSCLRDDMELAALQLVVSLTQVCFMPKDKSELLARLKNSLTTDEYREGVQLYLEWFDLFHEKWPFMQVAGVQPKKQDKNFTSLQKLFVGLPEKTSSSSSSNAFFNRVDEVETGHPGDVAIAIFQQATNGFSLGGSFFSVGLKGGMPLTTLVLGESLLQSVWLNILTQEFIKKRGLYSGSLINEPTWVTPPVHNKDVAVNISLLRGLFWQPACIKIKKTKSTIVGFYTEPGLCTVKGFWFHPHTPVDMVRFKNSKPKEKPYLSIRNGAPLWSQMLSFFYESNTFSTEEGVSCASVVQQYREFRLGTDLHLAVGGYVKGGGAESLESRRHEMYSLAIGWEDRASEMEHMIEMGRKFESALYSAVKRCCSIAVPNDKPEAKRKGERPNLNQRLYDASKNGFYKNTESLFHSILREPNWNDLKRVKIKLKNLVEQLYVEAVQPLAGDVKAIRGIAEGRRTLQRKIKEL